MVIAYCPACGIERTDYEGPDAHLPECPNCGSSAVPQGWRIVNADWPLGMEPYRERI